jgi:hypothetical protein
MNLFVDTSVMRPRTPKMGATCAAAMLSAGESLVTSDHVLAETRAFCGIESTAQPRNGYGKACAEERRQLNWSWQRIWRPPDRLTLYREQCFSVFTSWLGQLSRSCSERAASFDDHFAILRYSVSRGPAFTIVRGAVPPAHGARRGGARPGGRKFRNSGEASDRLRAGRASRASCLLPLSSAVPCRFLQEM